LSKLTTGKLAEVEEFPHLFTDLSRQGRCALILCGRWQRNLSAFRLEELVKVLVVEELLAKGLFELFSEKQRLYKLTERGSSLSKQVWGMLSYRWQQNAMRYVRSAYGAHRAKWVFASEREKLLESRYTTLNKMFTRAWRTDFNSSRFLLEMEKKKGERRPPFHELGRLPVWVFQVVCGAHEFGGVPTTYFRSNKPRSLAAQELGMRGVIRVRVTTDNRWFLTPLGCELAEEYCTQRAYEVDTEEDGEEES